MPKRSRKGNEPRRAVNLFLPPPKALYRAPTIYWCGNELEIEHFSRILSFDSDRLKLLLDGRVLQVTGDTLGLAALEKDRIRLKGRLLRIEFSDK